MLSWIPLIGPIIQGITSIFSKWQDTELGKYTIDGKVDVEAMKASTSIIDATRDDIGIRLIRDALLLPPVAWAGIVGWDTIVVRHWNWLYFEVPPYPPSLAYLPGAAFAFLLGNLALNVWRRK